MPSEDCLPEFAEDERDEVAEFQRRFESALDRFQRQDANAERKARRDLYQREMGLGYLMYVARCYRRLSQRELASRMRSCRNVVSRWEGGERLPSLATMQRLAEATDLELLVGLRDPEDKHGDLLALGIVFDEGVLTELLMLIDKNHDQLRVTPWRQRMARRDPLYADLLV